MKNLKKFFAFSIATAMVAGAVWAGTPTFKALASSAKSWWYDKTYGGYTDVDKSAYTELYTEVWKIGENKYTVANINKFSIVSTTNTYEVYTGQEPPLRLRVDCTDDSIWAITPTAITPTWSSSRTDIATIDSDGNVHANKPGQTDISCRVEFAGYNFELPTKRTITVYDGNISDVKITNKISELKTGQSYTLNAVVVPETSSQNIIWSSTNEAIATVSETGVVTALNSGDVAICAQAEDEPSKVGVAYIKVIGANSIKITPNKKGLYVGESAKLTLLHYPEDTKIPEVTWKSDNPSVVSVAADGTITGKSSGTTIIYAIPKDSRISLAYASISVTKEGIELSPSEATIYVGSWANIYALIEHNFDKVEGNRIAWSVDDSDKVYTYHSTDEDYWNDWLAVEGLKPGTAKITATIGSGDKAKSATSIITISSESSKQNATDPNAPTSEEQAKQEQTPESIANYQNWLATYGGGTTAAAGTTAVSGEVGQPGSEVIVNTGAGEPVAMFQSNDATNTLLAAPVGVVPSGTKIETVEAGKDTPAFKAVQNKLSRISRRGTVQKVYGIAGLNPDGSLMTLINGKAAMSMPMPTDITVPAGRSLKVYLIDDNGQTTKLDTAVDQGRVVFEIPKFGTFAFVVE